MPLIAKAIGPITDKLRILKHDLHSVDEDATSCRQYLREQLIRGAKPYVRNLETNVWHSVAGDHILNAPSLWNTRCGWTYARYRYDRTEDIRGCPDP